MTRSRPQVLEFVPLVLIVIASIGLQLAVLPSKFVGPDTAKFLEIAEKQGDPGFWMDPQAFDGNYWSGGYPTFLSQLLRVGNGDIAFVQIAQTLMVGVLIFTAWSMAFRLGQLIRITAALVVGFSPVVWAMARMGGYEILLSLLICSSLAIVWGGGSALKGGWGPTWWRSVGAGALSGVLIGIAGFVQAKALVLLPILLIIAWRWRRSTCIALALGTVGALLPWMIRNQVVRGHWSPASTNGPINIWIGNNPEATTGGFMEPPPFPPNINDPTTAAINWLISQPEAAFSLLMRKAVRLIEPLYIYPEGLPSAVVMASHGLAIALSLLVTLGMLAYIFGWALGFHQGLPQVGYLAVVVLAFFAVHLAFLAEPRFMAPVYPVAMVVAIATVTQALKRWTSELVPYGSRRSEMERI